MSREAPKGWPDAGAGRWLLVASLGALLCGCAGQTPAGGLASADRGAALAERACGACHGLGRSGESSWPGAAPFRDMRFDFTAISNERSMARLHRGRVGMPPAQISLDDVADIGAYVRSLQAPAP